MIYCVYFPIKPASILLWSLVHAIHDQMAWADFTVHFFRALSIL